MIQSQGISDKKFQIDSLDGLRGFAVLIVFLSHTSNGGTLLLPFADFSGIGKSGVYLFFVLSSFLLTSQFVKNGEEAKSRGFLLNYAFRRFFRVYPLYILYLLVGLAVSLWLKAYHPAVTVAFPFIMSFKDFIQQLLLIQGAGITWSILVEFTFYLFLPFLALTYALFFKNKVLPSVVLTVVLIALSQVFWPQSESLSNDIRLGPYLPIFFMGSLVAVLFQKWQEGSWSENRKAVLVVESFGFLAAIALILTIPSVTTLFVGEEVDLGFFHDQFILFGFLWSVVLFACLAGLGVLRKFFENRFLRYLGFISFSLYLWHLIAMDLVNRVAGGIPMKGWVMLIFSIAISHITWVLIEKPFSKVRLKKEKGFGSH